MSGLPAQNGSPSLRVPSPSVRTIPVMLEFRSVMVPSSKMTSASLVSSLRRNFIRSGLTSTSSNYHEYSGLSEQWTDQNGLVDRSTSQFSENWDTTFSVK